MKRRPIRADDPVVSSIEFSMADVHAGHSPKMAALLGVEVAAGVTGGKTLAMDVEAGAAAKNGARVYAPGSGRRMRDLARAGNGSWTCTLGGTPWSLRSVGGRWVAEGGGETRDAGSFKAIVAVLRKM